MSDIASEAFSAVTQPEVKRLSGDACWACRTPSPQIAHVSEKKYPNFELRDREESTGGRRRGDPSTRSTYEHHHVCRPSRPPPEAPGRFYRRTLPAHIPETVLDRWDGLPGRFRITGN
ncbi:hypothetical protein BJX61DRAFT_77023 [Aspergillus egyptiacus]|nr:hypothetical protein BJX61DRAFT_77023 [Aspergillus egyptiacus]